MLTELLAPSEWELGDAADQQTIALVCDEIEAAEGQSGGSFLAPRDRQKLAAHLVADGHEPEVTWEDDGDGYRPVVEYTVLFASVLRRTLLRMRSMVVRMGSVVVQRFTMRVRRHVARPPRRRVRRRVGGATSRSSDDGPGEPPRPALQLTRTAETEFIPFGPEISWAVR